MNVYAWSYSRVVSIMVFFIIIWKTGNQFIDKRNWKILNIIGTCVAIILILKFTVWGREPSDRHTFMFIASYSNEFWREMLMNIFLYFPLGLTLTYVIGYWSVLLGSILSIGIETWQFISGTGMAQGTDVLCNALGIAVGSLAYASWLKKYSK